MSTTKDITLPSKRLDPDLVARLQKLDAGQKIVVVQTVRVGKRTWQTTVTGVFRSINYLATGLSTERVPEDDLIVPIIHFTKDNGELSSIALDENTQVVLD